MTSQLTEQQAHLENTVVISRSRRGEKGKIVFEYLTREGQTKDEIGRVEGVREWTTDFGRFVGPDKFEVNPHIQIYSLNTHPAHEKGIYDALSLHDSSYMVKTPLAAQAESVRAFTDQQVRTQTATVIARATQLGGGVVVEYLTQHGEGPNDQLRADGDRQWTLNLDSSVEVFDNKRVADQVADIYGQGAEAVSLETVQRFNMLGNQDWIKTTTLGQHWGSDMGFDDGFTL